MARRNQQCSNSLFVGYGFHVLAVAAGRSLRGANEYQQPPIAERLPVPPVKSLYFETYRLLRTPTLPLIKSWSKEKDDR